MPGMSFLPAWLPPSVGGQSRDNWTGPGSSTALALCDQPPEKPPHAGEIGDSLLDHLELLLRELCCVAPLVLLALGVGGAWIGDLTALGPYRPVFIGATLLFFGIAFRKLYLAPRGCTVAGSCSDPATLSRQRLVFWVAGVLMMALLAAPWVAPLIH